MGSPLEQPRDTATDASVSSVRAEQAGAEDVHDLLARIDRTRAKRGGSAQPDLDRDLLALRHRAALALPHDSVAGVRYAEPDFDRLRDVAGVPEVSSTELSPEVLRAAILHHGCLLIRGLIDPDEAAELRGDIDGAFAARDEEGDGGRDGYYEEFVPDDRYELSSSRRVVSGPDTLWVVDSPRAAAKLFDTFDRVGLMRIISGYLGEFPLFSVQKSTLRRVKHKELPIPVSFWHQDGAFLEDVRALNVWLSLSRCGDVAPGLDVVPRRIDHILPTGTEGALFDWSVSQTVAEEAAGEGGIHRPTFEPGDALLFDEFSLHATGSSAGMPDVRYAVECWFFGASGFPDGYVPMAG